MEWLKTYHLVKPPLWFKDDEFANQKTCELRWYLLPIVQPLRGEGLNYPDQKSLIPAEYEVASAIEEITKIILMKKKFGAFQRPENLHRTNDTIQCGQRIAVGGINLFEITGFWDSDEKEKLGVALSRKPYI